MMLSIFESQILFIFVAPFPHTVTILAYHEQVARHNTSVPDPT